MEAKFRPRGGFERNTYERGGGSKLIIQSKVVPKEQVKSDGASGTKQKQPTSNPSGRKCFKCHGFEHITSDCPNRRIVALVEDEDFEEGTCENGRELEGGEEELIQANQGVSLVVQCILKVTSEEDKEDWVRKNVFLTKCTSHGKVCLMIIDNGSFENVVSLEMVQKLKLETIVHPIPYKLCGL